MDLNGFLLTGRLSRADLVCSSFGGLEMKIED